MNKKCFSYIIITLLCLNLLPQTSNAFKLNETKTDVIYEDEDEEKAWKTRYLPYARHLKLVNKATTMLNLVKTIEEKEENIDLMVEIVNRTNHAAAKDIVKWERDHKYIHTKAEEEYDITPLVRRKLLAEIEEEEEKENKEANQFGWKASKAVVKVATAVVTFMGARYKKDEVDKTDKTDKKDKIEMIKMIATVSLVVTAVSTILDVAEAVWSWVWNKKEINRPQLVIMPELPKNHKRVDVYSL